MTGNLCRISIEEFPKVFRSPQYGIRDLFVTMEGDIFSFDFDDASSYVSGPRLF